MKRVFALLLCTAIAACGTVRKQDLDAWVGMPVDALDTHSLFLTVPMYKTLTSSGIEVRNYANGSDVAQCFNSASFAPTGNRTVNSTAFTTCSSNRVVCNNLFYVRDGKVLEYAPTGQCFTDERVQPQARYLQLGKSR